MMPFLERLVTVGLLGEETSEPELERSEGVIGVDIWRKYAPGWENSP